MTSAEITRALSNILEELPPGKEEEFYNALAPFITTMAHTGIGTNACLDRGSLPLPIHCYSPVPDVKNLLLRGVYDRKSAMGGIDWDVAKQAELLLHLGKLFGAECDWPLHSTGNPDEFYTENPCFSFGCAAALHRVIRFCKPQNLIEIGSGFSSQIINAALRMNNEQTSIPNYYTIIDPGADQQRISRLGSLTDIIPQQVELLPLSFFKELKDGDILFIDSGHVVRAGGDVNFLILDVLPILAPGVVVHFHDIWMPYELDKKYHLNPSSRFLFTEAYLLQAFLAFNKEFEVLFSMPAITAEYREILFQAFPYYNPEYRSVDSGSIWLRRLP